MLGWLNWKRHIQTNSIYSSYPRASTIISCFFFSSRFLSVGLIYDRSFSSLDIVFVTPRQRERKEKMYKSGIPLLDENRSLSLIFRGAKTLDLMVEGSGERETLLNVLNGLVAEYGRAKVKVGNEVLLLRYIWNDIDRVSMQHSISRLVSTTCLLLT